MENHVNGQQRLVRFVDYASSAGWTWVAAMPGLLEEVVPARIGDLWYLNGRHILTEVTR